MQDNQTTIELQTEHPEAGTESTSLPDVDAENENPVGEIICPTLQMIHTFT